LTVTVTVTDSWVGARGFAPTHRRHDYPASGMPVVVGWMSVDGGAKEGPPERAF